MINRIFNYIFNTIVWQSLFRFISRLNFRIFTNNITAQLLTMSITQLFLFLRDIISNRLTNNIFFRIVTATPALVGINPLEFINSKSKKAFWIGFVFTLILYRQYILFKRLFLWPFKLGIYSFFYSLTGLDMSWFLSWFDYFPLNIPQWVYVQYLTLYRNWLDWWKGTVKIKNIKTEYLASIPKSKGSLEGLTTIENTSTDNKIINKNNILILVGVVTLIGIGVGIWYFYYSGNGSAGGGHPNNNGGNVFYPAPPAPNTNDVPHTITISDNQTNTPVSAEPGTTYDPNNNNLIDRLDATEAWGDPSSDPWSSNEASSSSSINRSPSPTGSTDSSETVTQSSVKADYDHYFQYPKD